MRTAQSSSRPGGSPSGTPREQTPWSRPPWRPAARQARIPPPMHAGIARPPRGQNSWHTLVKILPCPKLRLRVVNIKQKSILVGCIPLAHPVHNTGGVLLGEGGYGPGSSMCYGPTPVWTDWQTPVKTLPSCITVAGANKKALQSNACRPLADRCLDYILKRLEHFWEGSPCRRRGSPSE